MTRKAPLPKRACSRTVIPAVLAAAGLALAGCAGAAPASYGQLSGTVGCAAGTVAGLKPDQAANAKAIAAVALGLGLGQQGVLVGIDVALTESTLVNVAFGDYNSSGTMTTSRGLFQQIAAWAPEPDRMDPTKAATMFYTGGTAGQRGLMQVPGWQNMPAPQAAQAVQGSQFSSGSNYAAQLPLAQQVTAAVMATCTAQTPTTGSVGGAIAAAAQSQLGVRYSWGGGSLTGPTLGQHDGGVADSFGDFAAIGWDCSGLTRFAVYQATRGQVTIPRTAADQRGAGSPVAADLAQMLPGDLVVFGTEHVGIYVGGGRIIDAPQSGTVVRYDSLTGGGVNGDPATWTVRRIIPGASAS